jgi:hypothetical protein
MGPEDFSSFLICAVSMLGLVECHLTARIDYQSKSASLLGQSGHESVKQCRETTAPSAAKIDHAAFRRCPFDCAYLKHWRIGSIQILF